MAITLSQQPTSPNMGNNDLLYVVNSTQKTQPQFQYVCDIYESGSVYSTSSANYVQRIKQQPNPNGYGVFNVGQILIQYLGDDKPWKAAPFQTSSFTQGDFIVRFGEQYGVSTSSSITTYNGINTTPSQNPALTGSAFYSITNGLVDPYDAVAWNFPSASYYTAESASVYITFSSQHNLSNAPTTQSINDGDYATIALYNGNFDNNSVTAQDVAYVIINVYNAAGSNIQNYQLDNTTANGGGPRTSMGILWGDTGAYDSQTAETRLIHIGVGPQNIADLGTPLNSSWAYYTVRPIAQGDDYLENNDGVWANIRFTKATGECSYNGVRFAWKNEFGVWDYYTFTLQSDSSVDIEREGYEQTFVDFSTANSTIPYDKSRRGQTQFYNALKRKRTANSNWLTQAEADWMNELFFSSNVYIQDGTDMLPVVITSANVVEKTNPRTQKNFQYRIEFEPANQPRPRQ